MVYSRLVLILIFSLLGSVLTAFAFAASFFGTFDLNTLRLPAVATIALMYSAVAGVVFSPFMYWCLKDKNLLVTLPVLYTSACVATVLLNILGLRIRFYTLGFYGAHLFWVAALLLAKLFAPVSWQK